MIGQQFGRLTVIEFAEKRGHDKRYKCRCACGAEKVIYSSHLKSGATRSCGCWSIQLTRARSTTHGLAARGKRIPEHFSWSMMMNRCTNPNAHNFKYYGGRGISVCDRWRFGDGKKSAFECFLEDMGPRPPDRSLDRIDVNGDYEPDNCRWATSQEQARNTRRSASFRRSSPERGRRDTVDCLVDTAI